VVVLVRLSTHTLGIIGFKSGSLTRADGSTEK
jgi:hypothetical protein